MNHMFEKVFASLWNRARQKRQHTPADRALDLGSRIHEEEVTKHRVAIPQSKRAEHIAILGKTGTGKSSLLRYFCKQDIEASRGFVFFDLHGDATPFLLATIAAQERAIKRDLSENTVVIEPGDAEFSVGLNPLEHASSNNRFVQIAEFAQVLKQRWHLDSFGARTDELLRNSLYVLAENRLTLIELAPFLSNATFRATCLKQLENPEIRQYFNERYDQASEPMRAVMREPILNKTSAFTADPHFRHVVGQQNSTFSLIDAIDQGRWVIVNLHKGKLGEQAVTLGSLLLTSIKNSLFARKNRLLFTLYCDEVQNLVAFDGGLETVLSEGRKFAVSVVSANQFLDQYPQEMRAAILAVGSHIFFRLSSPDAQTIATVLDGGKALAERLKNLPQRQIVVKTGHERWWEAEVPPVKQPHPDYSEFYGRCRKRWARRRDEVEEEIARRRTSISENSKEVLNEWE